MGCLGLKFQQFYRTVRTNVCMERDQQYVGYFDMGRGQLQQLHDYMYCYNIKTVKLQSFSIIISYSQGEYRLGDAKYGYLDVDHTCRNYEKIHAWAKSHALDEEIDHYTKMPIGYQVPIYP